MATTSMQKTTNIGQHYLNFWNLTMSKFCNLYSMCLCLDIPLFIMLLNYFLDFCIYPNLVSLSQTFFFCSDFCILCCLSLSITLHSLSLCVFSFIFVISFSNIFVTHASYAHTQSFPGAKKIKKRKEKKLTQHYLTINSNLSTFKSDHHHFSEKLTAIIKGMLDTYSECNSIAFFVIYTDQ